MTRHVTVAAIQRSFTADTPANIDATEAAVREAAAAGAEIILPSELFESLYFPQKESPAAFALAAPFENHPTLARFRALARELGVVLPTSYFEKAGQAYYNSLAVIDADGTILGNYRKSHIPDGPGYEEKYYFAPGDTGFRVWDTAFGRIGVGICWDQWYPEAARLMALRGADLLIYPTAIGWESSDAPDEKERQKNAWILSQRGHAVANGLPVVSVNRVGYEPDPSGVTGGISFWGNSFVAGPQGEMLAEAGNEGEDLLLVDIDLQRSEAVRRIWPFLRDRRIDAYGNIVRRFID